MVVSQWVVQAGGKGEGSSPIEIGAYTGKLRRIIILGAGNDPQGSPKLPKRVTLAARGPLIHRGGGGRENSHQRAVFSWSNHLIVLLFSLDT